MKAIRSPWPPALVTLLLCLGCADIGQLRGGERPVPDPPPAGERPNLRLTLRDGAPHGIHFSRRTERLIQPYLELASAGELAWATPEGQSLRDALERSGHFGLVASGADDVDMDALRVEVWGFELWHAPLLSVLSTVASFVTLTIFPGVRAEDLAYVVRVSDDDGTVLGDFVTFVDLDYVLWAPMLLFNVFGDAEAGSYGHFRERAQRALEAELPRGVARVLAQPEDADPRVRPRQAPDLDDDADRWDTERPPR